ncbi:hypothetical protein ACWERF_28270 [Streptomyces griseoluteus]
MRDVPKITVSHLEALLPVMKRYGVESPAILYALLRESRPKVTAADIRALVRELPGLDDAVTRVEAIREQAEARLTAPNDDPGRPAKGTTIRRAMTPSCGERLSSGPAGSPTS